MTAAAPVVRLDPVRPEAGPVLTVGDDDERLQAGQRHHVVTGLRNLGDVDDLVFQTRLVQRLLVGRIALHAGRLGVHGDGHLRMAPLRCKGGGESP